MDQPSDLPTAANAPSGSPVLPDAAPEPQEPAVIRRKASSIYINTRGGFLN